jgi:hypothetical protein
MSSQLAMSRSKPADTYQRRIPRSDTRPMLHLAGPYFAGLRSMASSKGIGNSQSSSLGPAISSGATGDCSSSGWMYPIKVPPPVAGAAKPPTAKTSSSDHPQRAASAVALLSSMRERRRTAMEMNSRTKNRTPKCCAPATPAPVAAAPVIESSSVGGRARDWPSAGPCASAAFSSSSTSARGRLPRRDGPVATHGIASLTQRLHGRPRSHFTLPARHAAQVAALSLASPLRTRVSSPSSSAIRWSLGSIDCGKTLAGRRRPAKYESTQERTVTNTIRGRGDEYSGTPSADARSTEISGPAWLARPVPSAPTTAPSEYGRQSDTHGRAVHRGA